LKEADDPIEFRRRLFDGAEARQMKTRWTGLIDRLGKQCNFHPNDGILQAYQDGALTPGKMETIQRHLRKCPSCRQTTTQQSDALEWFVTQDQGAQEKENQIQPQEWARLESSLNSYLVKRSLPLQAGVPISAMDEKLKMLFIGELQVYLGEKLVKELLSQLRRTDDGCQDLMQKAEPYLTMFLGERTSRQIQFEFSLTFAGH
jgi:hypothetical protein